MDTNLKMMVVIKKLSESLMDALVQNIQSLGFTFSEFMILDHLYAEGGCRTQTLGKIAHITSGTITHVVNKLIERGYVEKRQDEEDKRVFTVVMTDVGREAFEEMFAKHKVVLDELLNHFSEEEKLAFIEQVKYFGKTIETVSLEM